MTVLLPWPSSTAPLKAGHWRVAMPLKPSVQALPPRPPSALAAVSHLAADLSALAKVRPAICRQALSLRAGMAELVLLNRLRARTRKELNRDVLESAARVIEVTARSWFGDGVAAPAVA